MKTEKMKEYEVIEVNRLWISEQYRDFPLVDLKAEHFRKPLESGIAYLLIDGDEDWQKRVFISPEEEEEREVVLLDVGELSPEEAEKYVKNLMEEYWKNSPKSDKEYDPYSMFDTFS